jgi:hypothetical protein
MQLTTGYLTDKRVFCMYNQIVINLGLRPGDSGTCIYIVQHPNKNGCIGMAIAVWPPLSLMGYTIILKEIRTSRTDPGSSVRKTLCIDQTIHVHGHNILFVSNFR